MSETVATTAVLMTPRGRGAVATVRVEGPDATQAVAAHFHSASGRALPAQPTGRILFGRWGDAPGEELVVCRRDEEVWEIHAHGGAAASQAILRDLAVFGCQEIDADAWLAQHTADPLSTLAARQLAEARTARTAGILLDQYQGALRRAVVAIRTDLSAGRSDAAQTQLARLIALRRLSEHLVRPWRVVLAGPPNVGKSSLINALLGYQRALVFDQPGTTRDIVSATTALDGWPLELMDTAGLRTTDSEIEAQGVARAKSLLAKADLVLLTFDRAAAWTAEDADLVARWPDAICVYNKSDLPADPTSRPPGLETSALAGGGVAALAAEIVRRLVPEPPAPGDAVPFSSEIIARLLAADAALRTGGAERADAELAALLAGPVTDG